MFEFAKRTTYKIDKNSVLELTIYDAPINGSTAEVFIYLENGKGYKLPIVVANIQKTLNNPRFMMWTDELDVHLECQKQEL